MIHAAWDTANQDLFNILIFSTVGSAFFVIPRFTGTTLEDGARHGQQAWAVRHDELKRSPREEIRLEHARMKSTPTLSDQDPKEYLYIIDSCRDGLNVCDPPEGPTDRQYDDILLEAFPTAYKALPQAHLEIRDFVVADIRPSTPTIWPVHVLIHSWVLRDVVPPRRQ